MKKQLFFLFFLPHLLHSMENEGISITRRITEIIKSKPAAELHNLLFHQDLYLRIPLGNLGIIMAMVNSSLEVHRELNPHKDDSYTEELIRLHQLKGVLTAIICLKAARIAHNDYCSHQKHSPFRSKKFSVKQETKIIRRIAEIIKLKSAIELRNLLFHQDLYLKIPAGNLGIIMAMVNSCLEINRELNPHKDNSYIKELARLHQLKGILKETIYIEAAQVAYNDYCSPQKHSLSHSKKIINKNNINKLFQPKKFT